MNFTVASNNPAVTEALGNRIGSHLHGNELILISGPLGAGKTLLTKGLARGCGIDPDEVVSPTFVLMNQYEGKFPFFHFDLYRLGMAGQVADPGFDEYLSQGIVVVEWAQFLSRMSFAGEAVIRIDISVSDETRAIQIGTLLPYLTDFAPQEKATR